MAATLRFPWYYIFSHPLTKDAPLSALRRIFSWQLRSRLQKEIVIDWVCGQRLCVRRGMTAATSNIYVGLSEFSEMLFTLHFLRADDVYVDAGANVGVFTVLAGGAVGGTVIACEPVPDTFRALEKNVALNDLQRRVELHEVALGARDDTVHFTVDHGQKNRVVPAAGDGVIARRQCRLDDVVGDRRPTMLKIDVEGYEEEVLKGAHATLQHPSLLVVQAEAVTDGDNDRTSRIEEMLNAYGMKKMYYLPAERELTTRGDGVYNKQNVIFVKDEEAVRRRLCAAPTVEVMGRRL
jgi:FkbM family methyltransferase